MRPQLRQLHRGTRIQAGLCGVISLRLPHPLQTHIITAALNNRKRRRAINHPIKSLRQTRQIPAHQLVLQRNRRSRHHHRGIRTLRMLNSRHQISHRLTGTSTRLHSQMPVGRQRARNRVGHSYLPLAPGTADVLNDVGQHRLGRIVGAGRHDPLET